MWKVSRQVDGQTDGRETDNRLLERLTGTFGSGELKRGDRRILF